MGGGKEGDVRQEFSNSSEQTSAPHRSDSGGNVFAAAGSVDRAAGKPPSSSAVPARRLTEIHPAVHDLFRAGYELLRAENQRLRTELGKTTKTTLERVKERRLEGWSNKKISEEEDIPYNTVAHYASVLIGRGEIDPISKRRENTVRERPRSYGGLAARRINLAVKIP
jgi:hypothetical protein